VVVVVLFSLSRMPVGRLLAALLPSLALLIEFVWLPLLGGVTSAQVMIGGRGSESVLVMSERASECPRRDRSAPDKLPGGC
jgi:hypothetical protein